MNSLLFYYYSGSLLLGGFIALISGIIVYLNNKQRFENISWLALSVGTSLWSFGYFSMITTNDHNVALFSNWALHFGAIFIPICYLMFALAVTDTYERYKFFFYSLLPVTAVFLALNTSAFFVRDVFQKFIFNFAPDAGPAYIFFAVYFFAVVFFAIYILAKSMFEKTDPIEKMRLKYILLSSSAGFTGGGGVFFLTFNVNFPPYFLLLFTFYPVIITIAILRYKLFSLKILTTELLVFVFWSILLLQVLFANGMSYQMVSVVVLVVSIIFGVLLIRSVTKEVKLKEHLLELAVEVSRANQRLRRSEEQKSEFISIASHQLRTPLTVIKGYASMVMEGSFGKLEGEVPAAVSKLFQATQKVVGLVDDLLTLSRIERGKNAFTFTPVNIHEVATEVVNEMQAMAEEAGLTLTLSLDSVDGGHMVEGDREKLKQVLRNLVNNAFRFTRAGFVRVGLSCDDYARRLRISVSDTGIGIAEDKLSKIFDSFTTAVPQKKGEEAMHGSNLGLYLVKEIIKAHQGSVHAESAGVGQGSTIIVELPFKGDESQVTSSI